MKYSKQRQLILSMVLDNDSHPSAKTIYDDLKDTCPSLSLGTVYRNLNFLVDKGLIRKVVLPGQDTRYDYNLGNHFHFICDKCSTIYDFETSADLKHEFEHLKKLGFKPKHNELITYGICKDCASKKS